MLAIRHRYLNSSKVKIWGLGVIFVCLLFVCVVLCFLYVKSTTEKQACSGIVESAHLNIIHTVSMLV